MRICLRKLIIKQFKYIVFVKNYQVLYLIYIEIFPFHKRIIGLKILFLEQGFTVYSQFVIIAKLCHRLK